jgi:GMP synthase PP-ATPase subunit
MHGTFQHKGDPIGSPLVQRKSDISVEVFDEESRKLAGEGAGDSPVQFLAQGTIYPDVIESAGSKTGKATSSRATTTSVACPRT